MKFKKRKSIDSERQIFRLLITPSDILIVESRDNEKKEAYFSAVDLNTFKMPLKNFQLEDKYWVGIEAVSSDLIYFHKFAQPTLPIHSGIYAFDIRSKEFVWKSDDYSFLFLLDDHVYCFRSKFESREYFKLNALTGELIENLGEDHEKINTLRNLAIEKEDFSDYSYPEPLDAEMLPDGSDAFLERLENNGAPGPSAVLRENLILADHYKKSGSAGLSNYFTVFDFEKSKIVFSEKMNHGLNLPLQDPFMIYKDIAVVIKDKTNLLLFTLE